MDRGFRVGTWEVQPDVGTVSRRDELHELEPKVMAVLVYLAEHAGEVLSKERLLQAVWPDTFVTEDVLRRAVFEVRKALGDSSQDPQYIRTLPRRGYQLVAEVTFFEDDEESPVGRYRILEELGHGGMGAVYLAEDTRLGRRVALKFLRGDKEGDANWHRRLRREARAAAALDHPFICKVYDTGRLNGRSFIAMEYVQGEKLSDRLKKGTVPAKVVLRIGIEIAEALEVAHRHGIVHRDIKPSNLLLTEQGHIKVTDFGIAKRFLKGAGEPGDGTLTDLVEQTPGTPEYASPEQLRGETLDQRADLFQLGMVFYELLTGAHPFRRGTQAETTAAILHEEVPSLDGPQDGDQGPSLATIIRRLLEKRPEERFQTAREVNAALIALSEARTSTVRAGSTGRQQRRRGPPLWYALAAAALLLGMGLGIYRWMIPGRGIQSIAVLPLKNLSGNPEQEYFADGMTDALIGELGKISGLRVISFTSTLKYKNATRSVPDIAQELGVDAVVEGSVLQTGEKISVAAQLIQTEPERQLWSERYRREATDVLLLQSVVALAVARELKVELTAQEETRLRTATKVDPGAYDFYLKGRHELSRLTGDGMLKAIDLFEQSVSEDPTFAPAHVALADTYFLRSVGYGSLWPRESMPSAREETLKALELDENLAEAHTALARVKDTYDWDWSGAAREYRRSLDLNPNSSQTHLWYGCYLALEGKSQESIEEMQTAYLLDPLSSFAGIALGWAHYWNQDFDRAIAQWKQVLETEPDFGMAHYNLGLGYVQKGMYKEAIDEHRKALELAGQGNTHLLALLGRAYALAGRKAEAREVLAELEEISAHKYVSGVLLARIYLALNERNRALDCLGKAIDDRDVLLGNLRRESFSWTSLESDARFQKLIEKMRFPQE